MKKVLVIVVLAVFWVVSSFVLATSPTGPGKMRGIVYDEKTGQPLEGVTVKLFSIKDQLYFLPAPKTDQDGKWKALFVRTGSWNIDFEKAGYETQKISYSISAVIGGKLPEIEIKLRKIEGIALTADLIKDLEKGNKLFEEKKYQEALLQFEDILNKNPDVFILSKNIGNCYFAMENYEKAVECYLKVFEKLPNSDELKTLIGNSYVNAKNMEKAMEWYQKIPFEAIKDVNTLYNIGANMINNNQNELALKYFKRAVEVDAEFAEGYYQLGMTYTAMNQIPEALAALNKFMELAPDSPNFGTAKAIVDAFSKVK